MEKGNRNYFLAYAYDGVNASLDVGLEKAVSKRQY